MNSLRRQSLVVLLAVGGFVAGLPPSGAGDAAAADRDLALGLANALDELARSATSKSAGDDRRRAIDGVVAALGRVTESARALAGGPPTGTEAAEIGQLLARACSLEVSEILPAAWRAAAWFGHPASIAALQAAGERLIHHAADVRSAYLVVAREAPSLDARRAFLLSVPKVWVAGPNRDEATRKDFRAALNACAAATCAPPSATPVAAIPALLAAFETAMKTTDHELFTDLALALASAPCKGARAVLRRAIKARKSTREETVTAVLRALGEAGDAEAVPLLLSYLPGTSGPVFGAAYLGLWQASADGLRPHAKEALAALIPLLHEEGYAANAMSGADTPKAARIKERMAVVARSTSQMVPASKEGSGWHALLWKIVDSAGDALKTAPLPPERKGWTHVNGRVTPLGTDAWVEWWKTAK